MVIDAIKLAGHLEIHVKTNVSLDVCARQTMPRQRKCGMFAYLFMRQSANWIGFGWVEANQQRVYFNLNQLIALVLIYKYELKYKNGNGTDFSVFCLISCSFGHFYAITSF